MSLVSTLAHLDFEKNFDNPAWQAFAAAICPWRGSLLAGRLGLDVCGAHRVAPFVLEPSGSGPSGGRVIAGSSC